MESDVAIGKALSEVVKAVRFHFTGERELNRQFQELHRASEGVEQSKRELDTVIEGIKDKDEFRIFAEGARNSRF